MTKTDPSSQKRMSIAQNAYTECLKACEAFDEFLGLDLTHRADQVWWRETFEEYAEDLAQRIRKNLIEATLTDTGCLVIGGTGTLPDTPVPQRIIGEVAAKKCTRWWLGGCTVNYHPNGAWFVTCATTVYASTQSI